jgi:hypothetical protein
MSDELGDLVGSCSHLARAAYTDAVRIKTL